MGLREQIEAASAARAKTRRKLVDVPGGQVEVRGMTAGDQLRVGDEQNKHGAARSTRLMVALSAYEPGSDAPLWNPNDGADLEKLSGLDPEVFDPLRDAALEMSGLAAPAEGAEGNGSAATKSDSSSSPESSAAAPRRSGAKQ